MPVTELDTILADPGFHGAVQEMEALGLRVTKQPQPGSTPYGVLSGRAGTRWFLMPTQPRVVCRVSLALVQPLRQVPRALRNVSGWALGTGLAPILLRHRVHVSGRDRLAGVFGVADGYRAFLTGTAGPHRKLAVQYMDRDGRILGYAKVSRTPAVHALLANEAATLRTLHAAGLRTALVPRVLRHEVRFGTALLATDTVAGARGPRSFRLRARHLAFLDELAARTPAIGGDALLDTWHAQARGVADRLSTAWRVRLASALRALAPQTALIAPRGWAHGDFTPVNCFPRGTDQLFVFDWEYAGDAYPADFDLIRFLDAAARARLRPTADRTAAILRKLTQLPDRTLRQAHARLVAYACTCALRGALRQPPAGNAPLQWASQGDDAAMLDALLADSCRSSAPTPDRLQAAPAAGNARPQQRSGVA